MKKLITSILSAFFIFSFFGCGQPAQISKAVLGAVNNEKLVKLIDAPQGFDGGSQKIVFAGELNQSGHGIKASWYKKDTKKPIKSEDQTVGSDKEFTFELIKPATGWLDGQYTLKYTIDGQNSGEKNFIIQAAGKKNLLYDKKAEKNDAGKSVKDVKPETKSNIDTKKTEVPNKSDLKTPKSNPAQIADTKKGITTPNQVHNATFLSGDMCNTFNADDSCKEATTWYYSNAKYFYLSTNWQDLKTNDSIWAVWYWEGVSGKGEYLSDSAVTVTKDNQGFVSFSLFNGEKAWYSGSYWVEIYYNGNYFTTVPFAVYAQEFKPSSNYSQPGYYDSLGNYILYDGSGYYDQWGNFLRWGTDWQSDYPEEGYYDEYGKYILNDGTGFYDQYGTFWYWSEWYGDGSFNSNGDYILSDGSGYYDSSGNWWPSYTQSGDYDESGNYILSDGTGFYDINGLFHPAKVTDPSAYYGAGKYVDGNWVLDDGSGYYDSEGYYWSNEPGFMNQDGYFDSAGNYILSDGSGFYDMSNSFHSMSEYTEPTQVGDDGYYDAYGNYILNSGEGFFDPYGNMHDMSEYNYYTDNNNATDYFPADYYSDSWDGSVG